MFDAIVLRLRVARVQAEIVAQLKDCGVRDQDFVNRICQTEESLRLIDTLFKISYYKKSQAAVFLYASTVLANALSSNFVSAKDKRNCYTLLEERLIRMDRISKGFKIEHCLVIGEMEAAMDTWRVQGEVNESPK
ncbi:TPA: hypothetical protein ACQVMA_005365 [Serratia marcescens]|uniref:Uncharacterized protein n=1 Tax=Serratia nevei TaxID=2703794 RepID=A0AAW6XDD6_9GAMM|nr:MULTISPECIES: hypothetical protein [Serratia]EGT3593470.1 hypothetical protein [Serratia marcescens]MBH2637548.1 hypothetical protein [Serratia marcescens]MDK4769250.1 hypothetical protein [Serratia nevei]MDK4774863.1 hypothetical protein [Serratia nevei]MDK4798861.1 hypothetical protein [Serratia nevei]